MLVDYVVIGAGLSGLVFRRALARNKTAVLIEPNPGGWKIGEANSPEMFATPLLGEVVSRARALPSFAQKNGSLFIGPDSLAAYPIVSNVYDAMHVARDELETLLLDLWDVPIAREHVLEIDLEGRAVRTDKHVWRAREQIIDCSGGAMLVARAAGGVSSLWPITAAWRYFDVEGLDTKAFWAQQDERRRSALWVDIPNIDVLPERMRDDWHPHEATSLTRVEDGTWMWQIPLFGARRLSVGLVSRHTGAGVKELDAFIAEHAMRSYRLRPRAEDGPTVYDRVHVRQGFARRAARAATMDYILVGDAFMFVDPVYSVGTTIAVNMALEVAALLNGGGWTEERCARFNARYEAILQKRTEAFRYWYSDDSREADENTVRVQRYFPQMTPFQAGISWQYARVVAATLRLTGRVQKLHGGVSEHQARDWRVRPRHPVG